MKFIVNRPVVDLRREPVDNIGIVGSDPMQESQLFYGEQVTGLKEKDEWIYINAYEQEKCLPDGTWCGYPGWVKRKYLHSLTQPLSYNLVVKSNWARIESENSFDVSIGTRLEGIEEKTDHWVLRLVDGKKGRVAKKDVWLYRKMDQPAQSILETGRKMLGFPYFWGGRSAFKSDWTECKTSIDCSGFVNILYRIHGIDLPRDAHDQYLRAMQCEYAELSPGDLIFTAVPEKSHRMSHVMIYSGEGRLLEATSSSGNVREIQATERFGCPISEVVSGKNYNNLIVHFGKIL